MSREDELFRNRIGISETKEQKEYRKRREKLKRIMVIVISIIFLLLYAFNIGGLRDSIEGRKESNNTETVTQENEK